MIGKELINQTFDNEIDDSRSSINFRYRSIQDLIMKIYAERYDNDLNIFVNVESVTKTVKEISTKNNAVKVGHPVFLVMKR